MIKINYLFVVISITETATLYYMIFTENYPLEVENNSIILPHPLYGSVMTRITYLNSTIFSYGIAGAFSDETSSNSCAILFTDNSGKLIATTKFINR